MAPSWNGNFYLTCKIHVRLKKMASFYLGNKTSTEFNYVVISA